MIPFDQIVVQIVNGLVNGMILALVASGLTLIFGIMDIVNFAHGDLFMLGAYIGTTAFLTTGNFWIALVASVLTMALLGALLQVTALRPLVGRDPLTTILATFGISLVIENYALWQYGPVPRKIPEPVTGHFQLFYVEYPWYRIVIALMSAAIIGALYLFMKYGKHGIWIRAIIDVLHKDGVAILLVEQNVPLTLDVSDRVYIMEKGLVRHHAPSRELRADATVIHQYLGV